MFHVERGWGELRRWLTWGDKWVEKPPVPPLYLYLYLHGLTLITL